MTADQSEPDHPAAYALARHIADHPISTIQAAFRYLNAPITIELHETDCPDPYETPLLCPRCGTDISEYGEDDFVFRTGDERPYCSGECIVAAHRPALKTATAATPAHPAHESWIVELLMPDGHWAAAFPTDDHDRAATRLAKFRERSPRQKWRLVRLTQTYVEETP